MCGSRSSSRLRSGRFLPPSIGPTKTLYVCAIMGRLLRSVSIWFYYMSVKGSRGVNELKPNLTRLGSKTYLIGLGSSSKLVKFEISGSARPRAPKVQLGSSLIGSKSSNFNFNLCKSKVRLRPKHQIAIRTQCPNTGFLRGQASQTVNIYEVNNFFYKAFNSHPHATPPMWNSLLGWQWDGSSRRPTPSPSKWDGDACRFGGDGD